MPRHDDGTPFAYPHYPGDFAHVKWCKTCQRYRADRWDGETFPEWQERVERSEAQERREAWDALRRT